MITVPYSLELESDEDARQAVAGAVVTVVVGHMKIFLGASTDPAKQLSIVGSLRSIYRLMMNELLKQDATATDQVGSGNYLTATSGNITLAIVTAGVGVEDVALVISNTFGADGTQGVTHMYNETFDQLINVLLENLSQN